MGEDKDGWTNCSQKHRTRYGIDAAWWIGGWVHNTTCAVLHATPAGENLFLNCGVACHSTIVNQAFAILH